MSVYDRFDAATNANHIDAYAVLYSGVCIGRVVFKSAGICRCFAQVWNIQMAEGSANGGGYDRHTAAFEHAVSKIPHGSDNEKEALKHLNIWRSLFPDDDADTGERWDNRLIGAGYVVQHVI